MQSGKVLVIVIARVLIFIVLLILEIRSILKEKKEIIINLFMRGMNINEKRVCLLFYFLSFRICY